MSVYSMTGYASVQRSLPLEGTHLRAGLELRAVNSRFLDLSFRLPEECRHLEPQLRERLSKGLRRGKVELRAQLEREDAGALPQPSAQWLAQLQDWQQAVQQLLPQARPLSVSDVLRLSDARSGDAARGLPDAVWLELADEALAALREARAREGQRLHAVFAQHIAQLRPLAAQAATLVPLLVAQQRQRFLDRWQEALTQAGAAQDMLQAAQDRALSEATAFAIRIDVAEEVARLGAHLDEIEALLQRGGELGKRLDFLIQELHREANTLGSKTATLEMPRVSVDMKVLIEQMREQVQNLE